MAITHFCRGRRDRARAVPDVTENRRRQAGHQYGRVLVGVAVVSVEPQRGQ